MLGNLAVSGLGVVRGQRRAGLCDVSVQVFGVEVIQFQGPLSHHLTVRVRVDSQYVLTKTHKTKPIDIATDYNISS